jgi:hypothetical protein
MLEQTPVPTAIGGNSCHNCKYWNKQEESVCRSLGLVGNWGRCYSSNNIDSADEDLLYFRKHAIDRINVYVLAVGDIICIFSTDNYRCKNYEEYIPDVQE